MTSGVIFRIKRFALHDGPGVRITVFFKGCPLGCVWCHNPEGIDPAPQTIQLRRPEIVGTKMSVEQLMDEIEKDRIFFDQSGGGVTLSGGEPLYQPKFLETLLRSCRQRSIHTTLDTSGHAPADIFDCVLELVDLILFDIKLMDNSKHQTYIGAGNHFILRNFHVACNSSIDIRVRLPIIPGITDQEDNIQAISRLLLENARSIPVELLPYHRIGEHKYSCLGITPGMAISPYTSSDEIELIRSKYENLGLSVIIEGNP